MKSSKLPSRLDRAFTTGILTTATRHSHMTLQITLMYESTSLVYFISYFNTSHTNVSVTVLSLADPQPQVGVIW